LDEDKRHPIVTDWAPTKKRHPDLGDVAINVLILVQLTLHLFLVLRIRKRWRV